MPSSVNALAGLVVLTALVLGAWAMTPASGSVMCPPTTIEDLFSDEPEEDDAQASESNAAATASTAPTTTVSTAPTTTVSTAPTTTVSTAPTTTVSTVPTTTGPATAPSDRAATPSTTVDTLTVTTETTTTAPATSTTQPSPSTTTAPPTTPPSTTSTTTTTTSTTSTTTTEATTSTTGATTTTTAPSTTTTETTTTTTEPSCDAPFVYPMVFPLSGAGYIGSPFGAPRDGGARHHMGNDIAAPHMQPVVAVADGTVSRIGGDTGISGYRVHIRHDDGWATLYIHLNNDTAGTDDGNGIGIRPDLQEGDRVEAGEVIGWNGDSGNAESTEPHVHFELRNPNGTPVDPRASLQAADRPGSPFDGPFSDLSVDGENIDPMILLLSRGVPAWCEGFTSACPDDPVTAAEAYAWLGALVGLPALECDSECGHVTEADLVRTLGWDLMADAHAGAPRSDIPDGRLTAPPPEPPDTPDELTVREAYSMLGGTDRCLPLPDDERPLTRSEAAETIALYGGWADVSSYCPASSLKR